MRHQLLPAVRILLVLTVMTGLAYPLAMTGAAELFFPNKADGSLVEVADRVVGSKLVGQEFTAPRYFHGRPSAAGPGASGSLVDDAGPSGNAVSGNGGHGAQPVLAAADTADLRLDDSGPSNLGPSNTVLIRVVAARVKAYRKENGLADDVPVPVDAVTASGSGVDPQISMANARLQAPRVARERGLPLATVLQLVRKSVQRRPLGFLGEPGPNVLELNLALDR